MSPCIRTSTAMLAFAALSLTSFAREGDASARTLWIRLDPAAVSTHRSLSKDLGESATFDRKSNTLRLVLKPGLSAKRISEALARRREVLEVRTTANGRGVNGTDGRSATSLSAYIARIEEENEKRRGGKEEERGDPLKPEVRSPNEREVDFLRGHLDYLKLRAYPFDRMDASAYERGIEQAKRMPVAKIGPSKASNPNAISALAAGVSGKFKFIGPFDLNTPYRTYFGVRPSSGRVNAIAVHPTDSRIIYAGAPQGGVMKTVDGGKTWNPIGDNWGFNAVSSIALDPKNPNTLYVGTGDFQGLLPAYSMGIMKTTDGGATWTNLGRASFGTVAVSEIVIDPTDSQIVIATTGRGADGQGRVWRSTNGGQTWNAVINVLAPWSGISYAAANSSGVRSVYACGGGGNIYRSNDKGATWTKLTAPGAASNFEPGDIAGSAVDPNTVYYLNCAEEKIYKSTDSGGTFTDITGTFPSGYNWSQAFYDYYIACYKNGTKDHLFVGLIDVVDSPDGGTTWRPVGITYTGNAKTHNDQHSFAVNPQNPNEVFLGNDGGIYRANLASNNWTITGLNENLAITQFYHAAFHPTDPTRILGGTQDNASPVSLGNLARWENVGGGDGGFNAISPENPAIQFCTIYGFTVIMTKNNWQTAANISPNAGGDSLPFVTPVYIDPVRPRYLYGCTNYLWRYDIQTNVWTPRLGGTRLSNSGLVRAVGIAPSAPTTIYTGSDDGRLFVSTNNGTTWRNLNVATLPNRAITAISVHPTDPNNILVALSGTGTAHLLQCTNTAASTPVFTSVSGSGSTGLPDIPVNCIERDPFKPTTTYYVGNDIGLFSTGNGGATWDNATVPLGLPNVQVNSIYANKTAAVLQVATYGRGIWQIGLGQAAALTADSMSILSGTLVNGGLPSLSAADGNSVIINGVKEGSVGVVSALTTTFTVPGTGTLFSLNAEVATACSTTAATTQVHIKNWQTGKFEVLKSFTGTTTVTNNTIPITGSLAKYLSPNRKVEIVVRGLVPNRITNASLRLSVDKVTLSASTND